jgi:hypothetical protein
VSQDILRAPVYFVVRLSQQYRVREADSQFLGHTPICYTLIKRSQLIIG